MYKIHPYEKYIVRGGEKMWTMIGRIADIVGIIGFTVMLTEKI